MAESEHSSALSISSIQLAAVEPQLGQSLKRAGELIASHRLEEAEEELRATREIAAPDSRVLALLGLVYFKQGNFSQASHAYREATTLAPTDSALWLNLGLVGIKLGTFDDAIAALETAVKLRPDDRRAFGYLGYAYAKQGGHGQAAAAFRRAGQHELAAEMERNSSGEGSVPPTPSTTSDSESPKTPVPLERQAPPRDEAAVPAAPSETSPVNLQAVIPLGDFVVARALDLSPPRGMATWMGDQGLRFSVEDGAFVRESSLMVALGGAELRLARKRIRGSLADQYITAGGDRFLQLVGKGDILLTSPGVQTGLVCLSLDSDVIYLDESRVVAFTESLVFEVGRVPGRTLPLIQLRGTGHVVIAAKADEIVSVQLKEGDSFVVPLLRIAGWIGRVVVQGEVGGEMQNTNLRYVTCEGEGVLLLSRHAESR